MRFLYTAVLFGTISFSLCCWDVNNPDKTDLQQCKDWWSTMMKDYDKNGDIKRCITLIQGKCPTFLVVEKGKYVSQEVGKYRIKWNIGTRASLASNKDEWAHYSRNKKTGVCKGDDEGLGDCDFWWEAAVKLEGTDYIVDRCVKLIENKCPNSLEIISEHSETKRRLFGELTSVTLSYKYEGQGPIKFTRYE